ncbi:hypothetical protein Trydic_g16137 [Trypoxylus dichotomus]
MLGKGQSLIKDHSKILNLVVPFDIRSRKGDLLLQLLMCSSEHNCLRLLPINLKVPGVEELFDYGQTCLRKFGHDFRIVTSTGPSAEPCATPDFMRLAEEPEPILAGKPQSFMFGSSPSWRILSNAFARSRDTMTAVCFLLKAVVMWPVIWKIFKVVEWPDRPSDR